VKVLAKQLAMGDCATFVLRGSWQRSNSTVNVVGAPEVISGPPTDTNHNTAGAPLWTAALALNGTNVEVHVKTDTAVQVSWGVVRESVESYRV
jgi:hypothetical protein